MAQYYTKAQLISLLETAKNARNISWDDLVSLFMSTECGAELELPIDGWNVAVTKELGTSWGALGLFDGGTASATPASGGYGLSPSGSVLTVESVNAEGWYELEYSASVRAVSAAAQVAIAVNSTLHAESYCPSGGEIVVAGKAFVHLSNAYTIQLAGRGQSATDLEVRAAQFTAERILA
jgi:hypothetical protein